MRSIGAMSESLKQQVIERIKQAGTDQTLATGNIGRILAYLRNVPDSDPGFQDSASLTIHDLMSYWEEVRGGWGG